VARVDLRQVGWQDPESRFRATVIEGPAGQMFEAYNEEAFRYFLALERKRAERFNRSFLLLLVNLRKQPSMPNVSTQIGPHVATDVFGALCVCVREVDFMGWYREERVVGAVLSHGAATPEREATHRIGQRCVSALAERLTAEIASRMQVRVLQLRPRVRI
jgi:hypothetical protein